MEERHENYKIEHMADLADVRKAMRIDYFEDNNLLK